MLQELHTPPSELARRTNLEREVFLRIRQGGRVTPSEAQALASILDTDAQTVLAANPPLDDGLVVEVSRPKWRPDLRRLGKFRDTTEDEERWHLADTVTALVRRTVHGPNNTDGAADTMADSYRSPWTPLVEMHLRAELAALGDIRTANELHSSHRQGHGGDS
jgi:hypothetical protein